MLNSALQQIASDAIDKGPALLLPGGKTFSRPIDIVNSHTLSVHDKRAILAAWASDYYAVESRPAFRQLPGVPEPVTIDEVQSALKELDMRFGS